MGEAKEKVYILDGFADGAVSYHLFSEILNDQDFFLSRVQRLLNACDYDDKDELTNTAAVIGDLCELYSRKNEEYWAKGGEAKDATAGKIDIEALSKRGIPGLMESIFACSIEGLNPAQVLWDAIRRRRGEDERYQAPYAFSPKVIQYFKGIDAYIGQVNDAIDKKYYQLALTDMKGLVGRAEDMFKCRQAETETAGSHAETA